MLVGCSTTSLEKTISKGPQPPDLTSRPWGVTSGFLAAVEKGEQKVIGGYMVYPDEAVELAKLLKGLTASKEVVSAREAKVWLVDKKQKTKGYLLYKKRTQGWLVESFVKASGKS